MSVLLFATYDLGRQPFGVASPAAWLRRAGVSVAARDLSRDPLTPQDIERASRAAFYLPMHTATRLALPVIDRMRAARPELPLAAYGLYAPLNAPLLREHGVTAVVGPEAEEDLVSWALDAPVSATSASTGGGLVRLQFIKPDRSGLPSLDRYATLQMPDGSRRVAGATDATRGCKHRCRHCPIVPVYDGQFRVVPIDVVLADVDQQVAAGAEHITFGDPDFFNGPTHARRIVDALHARHPSLTYDVTIKIEHLLQQRSLLPILARTGCLFVTSAAEAVDDRVLEKLEKGHTRADFIAAVSLARAAGLTLAPTFVAFTPWTTLAGYRELLDLVEALDLVEHVASIQWGIRLLITHGSRLLELEDIRAMAGAFDPKSLTYPWQHADPRVDGLQQEIARLVGVRVNRPRRDVFDEVRALARRAAAGNGSAGAAARSGEALPLRGDALLARAAIPYLNEPWYC